MTYISNIAYSGMKIPDTHRYASVQKENKLCGKSCKEAEKSMEKLIGISSREKAGYDTSIEELVSEGFEFVQSLEEQYDGIKFYVGVIRCGQTYGNSNDTNFVINLNFLSRLGTDEALRNLFEEDVRFLNDFSKRFREQQLARGGEITNIGWYCDEEGCWGGWSINRLIKSEPVAQNMSNDKEKILWDRMEEWEKAEQELKDYFGARFIGFNIKWQEETKEEFTEWDLLEEPEKESESVSVSIGVNAAKIARKIAAAKTKYQLQMVMDEIKSDMQDVKAGLKKGWCDESEVAKVESLMSMAQSRMGQVENREATPEEESRFALASLL